MTKRSSKSLNFEKLHDLILFFAGVVFLALTIFTLEYTQPKLRIEAQVQPTVQISQPIFSNQELQQGFASNELVIKFKNTATQDSKNEFLNKNGLQNKKQYPWLNIVITKTSDPNLDPQIERLKNDPNVLWVKKNQITKRK